MFRRDLAGERAALAASIGELDAAIGEAAERMLVIDRLLTPVDRLEGLG